MPNNNHTHSAVRRRRHERDDRPQNPGNFSRSRMPEKRPFGRPSSRSREMLNPKVELDESTDRDRSPHERSLPAEHISAKFHDDGSALQGYEIIKKKFTGRCRLFVGNLPLEVKEDDLRDLFQKYGEISECYLSGKGYGFIRLDTRAHAEVAKEELDGFLLKGRPIRVRFAVHGAAVKVKGLSGMVSNELLHQAFSSFGDVERAIHIVDERGRPTCEGIVEFERKPGASEALRRINEGVFLLTANPKPIVVEPLETKDDDDGLAERMIAKNQQYHKERAVPPRFGAPGTFEFDFGSRWRELYQVERMKREQLEQELKEARERLENDMELAYQEYQTAMLREDLKRRHEELDRLEASRRDRLELLRRQEEERLRNGTMVSQASAMGFLPGGLSRMNANPHVSQQMMAQVPSNRRENAFGPGQPRDDNLVHGVQKLLQIFQSDGGAGGFAGPGGVQPPNVGLLGSQPPDPFFIGNNGGMPEQMRDRDSRASFEPSRRRHY